jgi:hypothetical protein
LLSWTHGAGVDTKNEYGCVLPVALSGRRSACAAVTDRDGIDAMYADRMRMHTYTETQE